MSSSLMRWNFNPRTPCGVRRTLGDALRIVRVISIHAPRVGCDEHAGQRNQGQPISIHAPRVGCDSVRGGDGAAAKRISIHAPRVGCDKRISNTSPTRTVFQSTHPVWGATGNGLIDSGGVVDFNPRTPCGVRLFSFCGFPACVDFNPRTPCGVRRPLVLAAVDDPAFQSTHPVWGATIQHP